MSGGNLPYHLRVKKEIERRLFVEQLRLISKVYDIEEYAYIGMAGPFSEDFKIMYDRFNFKHFFSYEMDRTVYKRQSFNLPFSNINYLNAKISKALDDYPNLEKSDETTLEIGKVIAWFDYTGFEYQLLDDFKRAITTLETGSIIKITLLTHASQLYSSNEPVNIVRENRVQKVRELLGENYFLEDIFETDKMTEKAFPTTVFELLKKIAYSALLGGNTKFLPISSYVYQDGMNMLTFTGILLDRENETDFLERTGLQEWDYGLYSYPSPLKIEVPFLSIKEKLHLDAGASVDDMTYFKGDEIASYAKFHRFYPTYAKIV